MITRHKDLKKLLALVDNFPVTFLTGSKRCGKSYLASNLKVENFINLADSQTFNKLYNNYNAFLNKDGLVIIDEINRMPEILKQIRYLTDTNADSKFLIVDSYSPEILESISKTLLKTDFY